MHFRIVSLLAAIAVASQPVAGQLLFRSCGFGVTGHCAADMHCVPESQDCTDLKKCPGYCDLRNQYPLCGGFRMNPPIGPECPPGKSTCKDDPRKPDSCGMACDAPGICLPNKAPRCDPRKCGRDKRGCGCPEGLFCYRRLPKFTDPLSQGTDRDHNGAGERGSSADGVCL